MVFFFRLLNGILLGTITEVYFLKRYFLFPPSSHIVPVRFSSLYWIHRMIFNHLSKRAFLYYFFSRTKLAVRFRFIIIIRVTWALVLMNFSAGREWWKRGALPRTGITEQKAVGVGFPTTWKEISRPRANLHTYTMVLWWWKLTE